MSRLSIQLSTLLLRPVRSVSLIALLAAGTLLLAGLPAAHADVLYDNGTPDYYDAYPIYDFARSADDFTLTSASTLSSFTFWSAETPGNGFSGTLTYGIYADNGGDLGALITSAATTSIARSATGLSLFDYFQEYKNDVTIAPVSLSAGTYWLALQDPNSTGMFWETAAPNASYNARRSNDGSFYFGTDRQLAFKMNGTATTSSAVPEGSTVALLALALPVIGAVAIRRRKK